MSGSLESGNILQNQLFQAASGQTLQAGQRNALNLTGIDLSNQAAQQGISATDMDMVGRAAVALDGMPPDKQAAAYGPMIQGLKAAGFGKTVPDQYPGADAIHQFVSRSMPVGDQYKMGLATAPGVTDALKGFYGQGQGGSSGGSFGQQMSSSESSNNPAAENQGHVGLYGFGTERLADLGMYKPAQGENLKANQWAGTLDIPGFPNVKTKADFEANPDAQKAAFGPHVANIDTAIAQTPGADQMDQNGLRAVAHLGGNDGMRKFVATGGLYDPGDNPNAPGGGTHLSQYYAKFAANGHPALQAAYGSPHGPPLPAGVAARTGGVDVAGPGAPAPGGSAGVPVGNLGLVRAPDGSVGTPQPGAQAQAPASLPGQAQNGLGPAAAPAPQLMPPQAGQGTGISSPQFQAAQHWDLEAAKLASLPAAAQSTQIQAAIAYAKNRAAAYSQADSYRQLGGGMQQSALTGKTEYGGPPTPRSVTDNAGRTWILNPTGSPTLLDANPSNVTGSSAEDNNMRAIAEFGPKVANGTATPQEQANYATAVQSYRDPAIHESPIDKSLQRINTRELPPGMPEPSGIGTGGSQPTTGSQTVTPGMSIAQRAAEDKLGEDFATTDKKSYDASNTSLGMLVSANNAAEILNRTPGSWTSTGAGANTRMEIAKNLNQMSGLFGGKPMVDPASIGEWEALNKQTKLMGMQVVNNYFGGSREAASIINGATTAVPNSENTYLGFRMVSSGIEQDLLRQKELYEFKGQQIQSGKPLMTAEIEFNKQHPVQNYTARAIANAVPDNIAAHLVSNPDTVQQFDHHFGPGIGEFILQGNRTKMGAAGVVPSG
jgi:hypothetical protein